MPNKDQKDAGVEKLRVVDNLTHLNHERLKGLIADRRVNKVWTIQGRFRRILNDDEEKTVINCKSSLVDVEDLVKKHCKR